MQNDHPMDREKMAGLAEKVDAEITELAGERMGFALFVFEFGNRDSKRMRWISNANRNDMIAALREFLNVQASDPRRAVN